MNQEKISMLARIYNTLMTINTKGEDTLTMAECLKAFQQVIIELQQEQGAAEEMKNE